MIQIFAQLLPSVPVPQGWLNKQILHDVLQVVFGIAGGIALLIIARAALNYTTSQGEPQEIEKAKNAILYAIAGLIISIISFSIVSFVLGKV